MSPSPSDNRWEGPGPRPDRAAPYPPAVAAEAGALALRKAAAFDDLARWLTAQAGTAEYTDAMGPEWVVSNLKSKLATLIEDGRAFRAGRRRPEWLRRHGW